MTHRCRDCQTSGGSGLPRGIQATARRQLGGLIRWVHVPSRRWASSRTGRCQPGTGAGSPRDNVRTHQLAVRRSRPFDAGSAEVRATAQEGLPYQRDAGAVGQVQEGGRVEHHEVGGRSDAEVADVRAVQCPCSAGSRGEQCLSG